MIAEKGSRYLNGYMMSFDQQSWTAGSSEA